MEIAVVDCFESETLLSRTFSESVTIYCLKRGQTNPPAHTQPFSFSSQYHPGKFHFYVESELELGFRLCQFDNSGSMTFYTARINQAALNSLPVKFMRLAATGPPSLSHSSLSLSEYQKNLIAEIKTDALKKYIPMLCNPNKPSKNKESAVNPIKNFIGGVIISKRIPPESIPPIGEIAEAIFKSLEQVGVIRVLSSQRVDYDENRILELARDQQLQWTVTHEGLRGISVEVEAQRKQPAAVIVPVPSVPPTPVSTAGEERQSILGLAAIVSEKICSLNNLTVGQLNDVSFRLVADALDTNDKQEIKRVTRECNKAVLESGFTIVTSPGLEIEEILRSPTRFRSLGIKRYF